MPSNFDQQKEINELLTTARDMLVETNKLYKAQSDLIGDIVTKVQKMNFKSVSTDAQELTEALRETVTTSNQAASSQSSFYEEVRKQLGGTTEETERLRKVFGELEPVTKKLSVGMNFWQGLQQGIGGVVHVASRLGGILGGAARTLGQLALSIISFPFAMLQSLIRDADQSGSNELQQALEDIRKEFGYLDRTAGGAIVTLGRSLKGELANTGLSVYRVFGSLAERLKYFAEYAKNLGETLDAAMRNIDPRRDAEALGAFNKALGLTAEGQKAIAQRSIETGQNINEINREIANYALQLSEAFGVTMKEVSRDMGRMMADVQHFGHLGIQQLGQVAVFTRRLGLEFKQLGAVMDRFTNFEDAATGAAHLSQAFGLNIDAFRLMQEQDPARKLEMLRKAFFAAGRSIESMTYQERRLLSQQTGLDDAGVKLAFSLKSQSLSYDQVTKKGDQAKKKQLTQAEALERLAGAIERMVQSGGGAGGGFLDRFMRGFEVGIKRSQEFREIMVNLRQALHATFRAGVQVGQAFVKAFPGIKDWFKGIAGIFQPARFRQMLNRIVDAFKEFFKDLEHDPRAGFRKFTERIKAGFTDWFKGNSPNGQRMLQGFKAFFRALSGIFAEGLKVAITGVAKGMRFITDLILHPESLSGAGSGAGGAASFVGSLLLPIVAALKEAWPVFRDAFVGLMKAALPRIGHALKSVFADAWPYIAAAIFGPAFTRAIIGALATSLVSAVGSGMSAAMSGVVGIFTKTGGAIANATSAASGGASAASSAVAGPAAAKGIKGFFDGISSISLASIAKAGLLMVVIAGALSIGGVMMAMSIRKIAETIQGIPRGTLIASMAILTLTVIAAIPLTKALTATSSQEMVGASKKMFAIGGLLAIIGLVSVGIMYGFKKLGAIEPATILAAVATMTAMTALIIFGIVPLANVLAHQEINSAQVAKAMLSVGTVVAIIAASSILLVGGFNKMNTSLQTVGIALTAMTGMTLIFGAVAIFAKTVGTLNIESGRTIKTIGVLALTVAAIGATAYLMTNLLGGLQLSSIATASMAIITVGLLFAAAVPLIMLATFVGGVAKGNEAQLVEGMLAMSLVVVAVGATTALVAYMLSRMSASQLQNAAKAVGTFALLFAAISPLLLIATGLGYWFMSVDPGGLMALIGMTALALTIVAIGGTAWLLTKILGNVNAGAMDKTLSIMRSMVTMFYAVSPLLLIASGIGALMLTGIGAAALIAGMIALSRSLTHIAGTAITLVEVMKGLNPNDFIGMVVVMTAMGLMYTAISGLLVIATAIGALALVAGPAMLAGGLAMKAGLTQMLITAGDLIKTQNSLGLTTNSVLQLGVIIGTMTSLLTSIGLLLPIAGVIGFAVTASFGVGGSLIKRGMETINAGVDSILKGAKGLIDSAAAVPYSAELKAKVDLVLNVTRAIAGFAPLMASALDSLRPGITEMIFGRNKDTATIINSFTELMKAMIGQPGGGGIIGLVQTIQQMIASFNTIGNPEQIQRGTEAIARILGAVGEFVKAAVVGPAGGRAGGVVGVVDSIGDFGRSLVGARSRTDEAVTGLTTTITAIMMPMRLLIQFLFAEITRLLQTSGITENGLKAAQALGDIFQAISGILTAMNPPREFFEAAGRFRNVTLSGGINMGLQTNTVNAYSELLKGNAASIQAIVRTTQGVLNDLIPLFSNMSPRQIESLKAALPLLSAITEMTKTIGAAINGLGAVATQNAGNSGTANIAAVRAVVENLGQVFGNIGHGLIETVTTIMQNISRINVTGASTAKVKAIKGIFDLIGSIGTVYRSFARQVQSGDRTTERLDGGLVYEAILATTSALSWLFAPGHGEAQNLIRALSGIDSLSIKNPNALKAKIDVIKALFETIGVIPRTFESIRGLASGNNPVLSREDLSRPLLNLTTLIQSLTASTFTVEGYTIPNPLVGGVLETMLRPFTGVTNASRQKLVKAGEAISEINTSMQDLGRISGDLPSRVLTGGQSLNSSIANFSDILTATGRNLTGNLIPHAETFVRETRDLNFARVSGSLRQMITQINTVSTELSGLNVANVNANMRNVANVLGVRAEQLTIQHRNFQINVNVNVQMDAGQLETAIINRPTSRIEVRPVTGLAPLRPNNRG